MAQPGPAVWIFRKAFWGQEDTTETPDEAIPDMVRTLSVAILDLLGEAERLL